MTTKHIMTIEGPIGKVSVFFDRDFEEYQAKLIGNPKATYYTDARDDAIATAHVMAGVAQ